MNNVLLWIAQGLLAAAFLGAGIPKVFTTDKYIDMSPWADDVPRALLIFIGIMEILGALGVILPRATKTLPWLTPLAALGLLTIMVLAIGFHMSRGEWNVAFNVFLAALSCVVAYGRWKWVP